MVFVTLLLRVRTKELQTSVIMKNPLFIIIGILAIFALVIIVIANWPLNNWILLVLALFLFLGVTFLIPYASNFLKNVFLSDNEEASHEQWEKVWAEEERNIELTKNNYLLDLVANKVAVTRNMVAIFGAVLGLGVLMISNDLYRFMMFKTVTIHGVITDSSNSYVSDHDYNVDLIDLVFLFETDTSLSNKEQFVYGLSQVQSFFNTEIELPRIYHKVTVQMIDKNCDIKTDAMETTFGNNNSVYVSLIRCANPSPP